MNTLMAEMEISEKLREMEGAAKETLLQIARQESFASGYEEGQRNLALLIMSVCGEQSLKSPDLMYYDLKRVVLTCMDILQTKDGKNDETPEKHI